MEDPTAIFHVFEFFLAGLGFGLGSVEGLGAATTGGGGPNKCGDGGVDTGAGAGARDLMTKEKWP